jgi:anti-sigma regulatory factor (Ser/Thr protein kinase)
VNVLEDACDVREALDVFDARRRVRQLCGRVGFPHQAGRELELVASELCTNILKYGIRGSLRLRHLRDPHRGEFIEVVAEDEGPQFHDLESALADGCDDRGPIDPAAFTRRRGLGTGLGTVVRFTHALSVEPAPVGKRITVRRYASEPPPALKG